MSTIPKLAQKTAKAVSNAESEGGSRELAPEGTYVVKLRSVEPKEGRESKQPYWLWTFEIPEDSEEHPEFPGKRFFQNTSLQESAFWKLKEVFDAFGVDPATDTDTLVGETVRVVVSQRVIANGPRTGQLSNQVESVIPADDDGDEDGDGDDDEPPF